MDNMTKEPLLVSSEAEQGLLGALLSSNAGTEKVIDFLRPEHFADPVHGKIYGKIVEFYTAGKTANPVTLKPIFEKDENLKDVEYSKYLNALAGSMVVLINTRHYGEFIFDLYRKRQLKETLQELSEDLSDGQDSAQDLLDKAESLLSSLSEIKTDNGGLESIQTAIMHSLEAIDRSQKGDITGVPTKLIDLDKRLGGLQPGELTIIAGRPGMGKTACALTVALNAAEVGKKVAFFSMEMSKAALGQRIIARYSGISTQDQRSRLDPKQIRSIYEATESFKSLPLFIDEATNMTVGQIRSRCRRMKRKHGLDLVVIDYIGLMSPTDKRANRVHQIEEITTGLKKLSKELNVPVLALSQLSRAVEHRDDKRPIMSDLRDSGSIEQDADVILFCYRDSYYLDQEEPRETDFDSPEAFSKEYFSWQERKRNSESLIEIITAKYRQGMTGVDTFFFDGKKQLVSSYSQGR